MAHKGTSRAGRSPRKLTAAERDALVAVLTHADFQGRDALLEQVNAARVVGGCDCGCASVDLAVEDAPPSDSVAYPIPNEATVLDMDGHAIGGVLVSERDGYLAQLEVYGYANDPISPFPPVDRLSLMSLPR